MSSYQHQQHANSPFTVTPRTWCSWQMLPGYGPSSLEPYFSPIYIRNVEGLKTGQGRLRLAFFNAFYAQGVQDFEMEVKVLKRTSSYLIAEITSSGDRSAILGQMSFSWLKRHCPELVRSHSIEQSSSESDYLNRIFSGRNE